MPISVPLPIAKGGTGQAATGANAFAAGTDLISSGEESVTIGTANEATSSQSIAIGSGNYSYASQSSAIGNFNATNGNNSSAFGFSNISSSNESVSFGSLNWAYGTRSNAFGYGCYGGGSNSSAFGYFTKTNIANTAEFGYWSGPSTRNGSLRTDSTGTAALTYNTSSTALTDGGATAGSEAAGTLPRGMCAIRHDGNGQTFLDVNDAGVVETKNITAVFGQVTSTGGLVDIALKDIYVKLTASGTLDTENTSNMTLDSGQTTLKNTSGYTRRFLITAYINASSNNQKKMIGLRIGKNGTSYAGSEARDFSDDTDHPAGITSTFIVSLANNEYADLYIANHTDGLDVTVNAARITATSID